MNVTEPYLKDFALPAIEGEPKELTLTEWEESGDWSIGLDDPDGRSLSILYFDEWSPQEQWKIKPGKDKRWTLVRITKVGEAPGTEIIEPIGYEFEGLYTLPVLREWFRTKLGMTSVDPS